MEDNYRMVEGFGDFAQYEKTYSDGSTAKIGVMKGASVEDAFAAQEQGFPGQIWDDNNGWYPA